MSRTVHESKCFGVWCLASGSILMLVGLPFYMLGAGASLFNIAGFIAGIGLVVITGVNIYSKLKGKKDEDESSNNNAV